MKLKISGIITGCLLLIAASVVSQQTISLIQVKMNSRTVNKGKMLQQSADIWYQQKDGKMVSVYSDPNILVTTNNKGEATVYDFKSNKVGTKQNASYSSEGSYFYFFLSNKSSDLGLKDMGFKLNDTKFENQRVITTWIPPQALTSVLLKVELVLENYKPIYMAYYNGNNKIIRKVFYYNYQTFAGYVPLPLTVTEIAYFDDGDSSITKTTYSDVLVNEKVTDLKYVNFKIPADAKKLDN